MGTLLIAAGAVLIAVFGTVEEPAHSLDELIALYHRPAFIAWFSVLCFAIIATLVTAHILEWSILRSKAQRTAMLSAAVRNNDASQLGSSASIRLRRRWSEPPEGSKFDIAEGEGQQTPKNNSVDPNEMEEQLGSVAEIAAAERKAVFIGIAYGGASGTLSGL